MDVKSMIYPRLVKSTGNVIICATGPSEKGDGRFDGTIVDVGEHTRAFTVGEKIEGWDLNYFTLFHGIVILGKEKDDEVILRNI